MKPFRALLMFLLLIPFISVRPQSIQLQVLDLGALDLGAFLMSNDLSGQPKIFEIIISAPPGTRVFLTGRVDWKQNESASSQNVFNFRTNVFTARSLFNNEIGNSEIKLESLEGDKNLAREIALKGKPSGVFDILITMFSEGNQILGNPTSQQLRFLNPTPPIINYPANLSSVDVGNIQINWTEVQGATKYEILAGEVTEDNQTYENAISQVIDAKDVDKNVTTYRIKDNDFLKTIPTSGLKLALIVKAFYSDSGSEASLQSNSVVFNVGQSGTNNNPGQVLQPDANMIRVANLLGDRVEQGILDKLNNGTIKLDQVQIEDENGRAVSTTDFLTILTLLESKSASELTITYLPKQ